MATVEVLRFSPEQQQAYRQIAGFFGRAERESPVAAKQLVNVVGGLVGEQRTTKEKLQDGMGNIDVGLALIGDWLKETGADGFEVKLGFGGGAKKAIGRSQINFPTVSDLIRIRGRVDPELQTQIPPLLSSFSRQIRGGLDVGLSPRQIVGGLVSESVGSRLSANGSENLREALNKPLGGHFEWIREALGIADEAGQPGFQPVAAVETKPAAAPRPLPEASPAEREFQRKKERIRRYLTQEGGMDFLSQTGDKNRWEFVSKRIMGGTEVWRPLSGVLSEEKVWLQGNLRFSSTSAASGLREQTRFLLQAPGLPFVNVYVYAHAPLDEGDSEGVGVFDQFRHWELIDFIKGTRVERDKSGYWPESLSPLVRLKVLLAACDYQDEAIRLSSTYLYLENDNFIVQPDGVVRMVYVDVGRRQDAPNPAEQTAVELAGLLCKLFYNEERYEVRRAIYGYFHRSQAEENRRLETKLKLPSSPALEEILRRSEMLEEIRRALLGFLDDVQGWRESYQFLDRKVVLDFKNVPEAMRRRILPIAQRLERQESATRGEEIAQAARGEARRRVEETLARPEEAAEVVLNADERDLMLALENLVEMERQQATPLGVVDLQIRFIGTQRIFSKLSADSMMRAEVMKNVVGQLGAEGERLMKAGKQEREIFDEWLKRVFIPLYRLAKKKH